MPMTATSIDPLAQFLASKIGDSRPIPLIATRIDVSIRGGLAAVTTERTFRNVEKHSIEATITFPVPIDATLCALSARIDGRTLNAIAQARSKARATYEAAIDEGKSAVLHEELLKGIHMLSVGHLRPGGEVIVIGTWTAPLSLLDGEPRLRIPTTVGEIYGRSPLSPSDDLVTGETVHEATLGIDCDNGIATLLRAGVPVGGRYRIALDAPIDIVVAGWRPHGLEGVAADGRKVALQIEPAAQGASSGLNIDLLFDHSGSMSEQAAGGPEARASKFEVAKGGLMDVARERLKPADCIRLWEFNDQVHCIGEAAGDQCEALAGRIRPPDGGTEIGRAFDAVIASGTASDVVIVTDGKSWAFDPQTVARTGIRVTAVLIGEDALEAGIAHLAGMSGGQVFAATGGDADRAIATALDATRAPHQPSQPVGATPTRVETTRRGARLVATWGEKVEGEASVAARRVGAMAAMLAIPLMPEDAATKLAEAEGIVCHLTSLVLVDEAGARQEGIPASRKVALSAPRTAAHAASPVSMLFCLGPMDVASPRSLRSFHIGGAPQARQADDIPPLAPSLGSAPEPASGGAIPSVDLGHLVRRIDWDADPEALRRGDLAQLSPKLVSAIHAAAKSPEIVAFATALGIDPVIVVIALLARAAGKSNRSAQRIARGILGRSQANEIGAVMTEVGL